jgi:hypothetical protein
MLQITNASPFAVERGVLYQRDGGHAWVVAIKGSYAFDRAGRLQLAEQEPVVRHPRFTGEAGASTLLRDSEIVLEHPGVAVTLYGEARPLGSRPCERMQVGFELEGLRKTLEVWGDRHWRSSLFGLQPSAPAPITAIPLTWEHAFGGCCPATRRVFGANPVGKGFASSAEAAHGLPLPNLEDPGQLIRHWNDRPEPACMAAVPAHWAPRCTLGGTADERWQRERAPLLPEDTSPRFFVAAPVSQQLDGPLQGGERLRLFNLAGSAELDLRLPRVFFDIRVRWRSSQLGLPVRLERVIVDTRAMRLHLAWRGALDCGLDARCVQDTLVDTKLDLRTGRRDGLV